MSKLHAIGMVIALQFAAPAAQAGPAAKATKRAKRAKLAQPRTAKSAVAATLRSARTTSAIRSLRLEAPSTRAYRYNIYLPLKERIDSAEAKWLTSDKPAVKEELRKVIDGLKREIRMGYLASIMERGEKITTSLRFQNSGRENYPRMFRLGLAQITDIVSDGTTIRVTDTRGDVYPTSNGILVLRDFARSQDLPIADLDVVVRASDRYLQER